MSKRMNAPFVAVLCAVILLISGWCPVNAAALQQDHKETVIQASQKLLNFANYRMTIDSTTLMTVQGKHVKSVVKGEYDVQVKPLLGKNTIDITTYVDSDQYTNKIVQYIEENEDQIAIYSNMDKQWLRQSLPKAAYNPLNDYNSYIKAIKNVTIKNQDADATVFKVVASGTYMKEELKRSMALVGVGNIQLTDDFLKELSDLTYYLTIDRKTGTVTRVAMDSSDFMKQFGNSLVDTMQVPNDKKALLREMFNSMKTVTHISFSQFNKIGKITIPQDAVQTSKMVAL